MRMATKGNQSATEILNTVLAAKSAGVELPVEMKSLVMRLLTKQLDQLKALDDLDERHRKASVEAAKRIERMKANIRRNCPHKKSPVRTALQGQHLAHTGQMALVCSRCGSNFHTNPIKSEGQHAPPPHLVPNKGLGSQQNVLQG
jgi:hypothetical protein